MHSSEMDRKQSAMDTPSIWVLKFCVRPDKKFPYRRRSPPEVARSLDSVQTAFRRRDAIAIIRRVTHDSRPDAFSPSHYFLFCRWLLKMFNSILGLRRVRPRGTIQTLVGGEPSRLVYPSRTLPKSVNLRGTPVPRCSQAEASER